MYAVAKNDGSLTVSLAFCLNEYIVRKKDSEFFGNTRVQNFCEQNWDFIMNFTKNLIMKPRIYVFTGTSSCENHGRPQRTHESPQIWGRRGASGILSRGVVGFLTLIQWQAAGQLAGRLPPRQRGRSALHSDSEHRFALSRLSAARKSRNRAGRLGDRDALGVPA